jgi:transposase
MVTAALDIHKSSIQAVVLDTATGQVEEERLADRSTLASWASRSRGRVVAVAVEATTGWRWVARELEQAGLDVRLVDPGQAKALQGRKRRPKTDRLDARWLALLLARDLLPQAWMPPPQLQELRDQTRLRKALADDRTRWAQRLHALLQHEGWPCARSRLLTQQGRRWARALALPAAARAQVECQLRVIEALECELGELERTLRRFAREDERTRALQTIFGVGPILACHLLAEIGDARRFRRSRQVVRLSGLDPSVHESADQRRRGRLAKQGPPTLRWALVQAAKQAHRRRSPDGPLYARTSARLDTQRATLTVARKIARRAYHVLTELEQAA